MVFNLFHIQKRGRQIGQNREKEKGKQTFLKKGKLDFDKTGKILYNIAEKSRILLTWEEKMIYTVISESYPERRAEHAQNISTEKIAA